jgi:hypothetical protein
VAIVYNQKIKIGEIRVDFRTNSWTATIVGYPEMKTGGGKGQSIKTMLDTGAAWVRYTYEKYTKKPYVSREQKYNRKAYKQPPLLEKPLEPIRHIRPFMARETVNSENKRNDAQSERNALFASEKRDDNAQT